MQRTDLLSSIAPSAYVIESQVQQHVQDTIIAQEKITFSSQEEFVHFLTHKVSNNMHKNGRIYMKIDEKGSLYANSVSPYADIFEAQLEPNIKPLVQALNTKRYLTYSSCEGHGNTFRRYVGLAFADKESREYVKNYIKQLGIWGVYTIELNSVSNQNLNANEQNVYKPLYESKIDTELTPQHPEQEAFNFNIQFHRHYERYYFLEIVILQALPYGYGKAFWRHPIKHSWLCLMKKYFWNHQTKKVTQAIESSSFQKYRY